MSSTIRTTIHEALVVNGLTSYERQAEPVITALEEREDAVTASLREQAEQYGLPTAEVERILINAGLVEEPTPEPESVSLAEGEGTDLSAMLAAIEGIKSDIEQIRRAAARHGVSV